ncbi:MAG: hypothetical protein AB8F94_24075 [Saprospiraceae bacterium]
MIENLKKGILLKIGDTLETLQLRLMLNRETIVNEENISPTLKEAIDFYKSIAQQNQQANRVIQECEDTIEKLLLLKKHSPDLSINTMVKLYNNYEAFPKADFQKELRNSMGIRQGSSQ